MARRGSRHRSKKKRQAKKDSQKLDASNNEDVIQQSQEHQNEKNGAQAGPSMQQEKETNEQAGPSKPEGEANKEDDSPKQEDSGNESPKLKYKPGDLIVALKPDFHNLHFEYTSLICDYCFNSSNPQNLIQCLKCARMYYCNEDCRKMHWRLHRSDCEKTSNNFRNDDEQFLERFSLFIKNNQLAKKSQKSIQDENKKVNFSMLKAGYHPILFFIQDFRPCSAMTNAVTIDGEDSIWSKVGKGIYLPLTLLKNSCSPNAYYIFRGTTLELRATRNIYEGEEITYCRTNYSFEKEMRKQQLKCWAVECNCEVCQNPDRNFEKRFQKSFEMIYKICSECDPDFYSEFIGTEELKPNSNATEIVKHCEKFVELANKRNIFRDPFILEAYYTAIKYCYHFGLTLDDEQFYERARTCFVETLGSDHPLVINRLFPELNAVFQKNVHELYAAGDIIREIEPFFNAVVKEFKGKICDLCNNEPSDGSALQMCGGCRKMFYCNPKCQREHWKTVHKIECSIIAVSPNSADFISRLICFVIRNPLGRKKYPSPCNPKKMIGFFDIFPDIDENNILSHVLQATDEFYNRLEILKSSTFSGEVIREAFYLFDRNENHSCRPNAYLHLNHRNLVLRASRKINSDEKISFSAIDFRMSQKEKKKFLSNKYIVCRCEVCRAPTGSAVYRENQKFVQEYKKKYEICKLMENISKSESSTTKSAYLERLKNSINSDDLGKGLISFCTDFTRLMKSIGIEYDANIGHLYQHVVHILHYFNLYDYFDDCSFFNHARQILKKTFGENMIIIENSMEELDRMELIMRLTKRLEHQVLL